MAILTFFYNSINMLRDSNYFIVTIVTPSPPSFRLPNLIFFNIAMIFQEFMYIFP